MRRPDASTIDAGWTPLDRVRSTHRAAQVWAADELRAVVEIQRLYGVVNWRRSAQKSRSGSLEGRKTRNESGTSVSSEGSLGVPW